ncbi:MAG: aminoacyl-tRNA hydrolase [Ruminiclostridium sp.]|nr:aminoacyl-tRNA hydrolase [Ruminiclostridium sp.]
MSVLDILNKLKTEREPMVTGSVEYIICGLGNPGTQYENTRYNAGFMAIDTIAERLKTDVKKLKFKSLTADVMIGGVRCLLMKPTTFMNNSGEAVREALNFYKLSPERLIVIYDDISMDVGRTRIRKKGSDGGHNGIKSIILCTNTDTFPRIKIGVGAKPHPDYNLADWVLSPFLKEQAEALETALMNSALAAELMVQGKTDEAMNKYNK